MVPVTELADLPVPALEEPTLAPAVCVTGWPVPVADGGSPAFAGVAVEGGSPALAGEAAVEGGSPALAGEVADLAEDPAVFTVFTAVLTVEPTADWTVDWPDPRGGAARVAA
jgi:hypothetical protein